jgi:hypothetical protein
MGNSSYNYPGVFQIVTIPVVPTLLFPVNNSTAGNLGYMTMISMMARTNQINMPIRDRIKSDWNGMFMKDLTSKSDLWKKPYWGNYFQVQTIWDLPAKPEKVFQAIKKR